MYSTVQLLNFTKIATLRAVAFAVWGMALDRRNVGDLLISRVAACRPRQEGAGSTTACAVIRLEDDVGRHVSRLDHRDPAYELRIVRCNRRRNACREQHQSREDFLHDPLTFRICSAPTAEHQATNSTSNGQSFQIKYLKYSQCFRASRIVARVDATTATSLAPQTFAKNRI